MPTSSRRHFPITWLHVTSPAANPVETAAAISASLIRAPGGMSSIDATGRSGGAGGNATPLTFKRVLTLLFPSSYHFQLSFLKTSSNLRHLCDS